MIDFFFLVPGYLYEGIPILSYCHIRVNKPPNNKQFGTPEEKIQAVKHHTNGHCCFLLSVVKQIYYMPLLIAETLRHIPKQQFYSEGVMINVLSLEWKQKIAQLQAIQSCIINYVENFRI